MRYVESDGADGHVWRGAAALLMTIDPGGDRQRTVPLIYGRRGEVVAVVASKSGHPEHPSWLEPLLERPRVAVQVAAARWAGDARLAEGTERDEWWRFMCTVWPAYESYRRKTSREIPVVLLEPAARA